MAKDTPEAGTAWPFKQQPVPGARIVLASQGPRIWTCDCRMETAGEVLRISGADATTLGNLSRQHRVAFSIITDESVIQGSGIAVAEGGGDVVRLEPYRLSDREDTFELKLQGWTKVDDVPAPNVKTFSFWYQAFRMVTVQLTALPVIVGAVAAFALGSYNVLVSFLALLGVVFALAGGNGIADYFDFKNGVDLSKALSSHMGALAQERVEPELILIVSFICFMVTVTIGIILVQLVGWGLLWFGLAGVLGAFFYTGKPVSYKYRALGELMLVLLCGPLIVMGSYYAVTQGWDWGVFLVSVAIGMIAGSVSLVNNLRDIPDDKLAGIRTLPMSLGVAGTKKLYYTLIWGPYLVAGLSLVFHPEFWPLVLSFISIPKAWTATRMLKQTTNDIDDVRATAMKAPYPLFSIWLHSRFTEMLIAGLVITGIVRLVTG